MSDRHGEGKGLSRSNSQSSVASSNNHENGKWELTKQYVKNIQKRHRKDIKGTVNSGTVKGAPAPTRYMFIYRVDPATEDDALKQWISETKVNILDFERVSHGDAKFKSFKWLFPYKII